MVQFTFAPGREAAYHVLCLGAHSDDIEIGCGGTMLTLAERYPCATFTWVVFSAEGARAAEAQTSARSFLPGDGRHRLLLKQFPDGYFPYQGAQIKDYFEELKRLPVPDLVFTHCGHDRHQDHRLLNELTWNTFRDHTIFEYEIPKYDGDLQTPNVYVHLSEAVCQRKITLLRDSFATQANKPWFTDETFRALLRLRGIEARAPGQYAEGFYCRKLIL
jgi:LmbE family N-acetylglucosaminyl deacetylase